MLKTISYLLIAATLLAGTPVLAAPTSSLQISGHILGEAPAGLTVQATASDPYYRRQKYLSTLKIPAAWDVTTGTATTIAVIDTGINRQHPEFSGRLWVNSDEVPGNGRDDDNNGFVDDINGYNFVNNSTNLTDEHGHGTGIASVIAANTNNSEGIAGVDRRAKIMVVKALNEDGGGEFANVTKAVRYAVNNGAKIINMSFGATSSEDDLKSAVDLAIRQNVIIVAASGNAGRSSVFYPAAYPAVIAVGSIDSDQNRSSFSNYGKALDVVAPGEGIIMAGIDDHYLEAEGSSFAAALVSGVASLALSAYPNLTPSQFAELLKTTSTPLGRTTPSTRFGYGIPNASAIVNQPRQSLSATFTQSQASAPADGMATITITATVRDGSGTTVPGADLNLASSSAALIINGVPATANHPLGQTDSNGNLQFTVSSTMPETKQIALAKGPASLQGSVSPVFTPVANPAYKMQWVQQSPYLTLSPDATSAAWLEVKNVGNVAWLANTGSDTRGRIILGTDYPLDRSSIIMHSNWISMNRVVTMQPSIVRPGETARFEFSVQAPKAPGTYKEYFRPVVEHVSWLNDLGIYWEVRVK